MVRGHNELPVKPATWRTVELFSEQWLNALLSAFLVELDMAMAVAVVCDRASIHAQLFDPLDNVGDLVARVSQTEIRV